MREHMMQTEMYPEQLTRPSSNSKDVIKAAAAGYADKMHGKWSEWSKQEWIEGLVKHYAHHKDGYETAKDMESDGFAPDSEMVSDLDDFGFEVSRAHRNAVIEWVKKVGFEPVFSVGDAVDMGESHHRNERFGIVSEIRHDTAEYAVKTDPASTSAFIIRSENLSPRE